MESKPRHLVYAAIDSERDYQIRRWGHRQPDGSIMPEQCSVGDFLVKMTYYLDNAKALFACEGSNRNTLVELRKAVALGVSCFEQHGIDIRDLSWSIMNMRDHQPI